MPEQGVCQCAQSPKVRLSKRGVTKVQKSLSAPNPPWQRLVQVPEATAAFLCSAQDVCSSSRERGAADEGLAPCCHHCRVFMGHSWISRSQVGAKCHPAPMAESPPYTSSLKGFIRRDTSWRQGGLGKKSPEQVRGYPGHRCGSPNTASSFPPLAGIPCCQATPCPLCLQRSLPHRGASPQCGHTAGPGPASPGKARCPWALEQAAHVVPVTQCQAGRMHVQSFFWERVGLGVIINIYSTGRCAKVLSYQNCTGARTAGVTEDQED